MGVLVATSSTSNMPAICASNSAAALPISSPILNITHGTYKLRTRSPHAPCGTLCSQNGGGTNPGGVSDKVDNAIKLVMGLAGVMEP